MLNGNYALKMKDLKRFNWGNIQCTIFNGNFYHLAGYGQLDENTMEKMVEVLERHCHENMNHAIETEEGLGIEYDEDVICDVCRSPDSEDGNDMVFCDKCNICVHQVC